MNITREVEASPVVESLSIQQIDGKQQVIFTNRFSFIQFRFTSSFNCIVEIDVDTFIQKDGREIVRIIHGLNGI